MIYNTPESLRSLLVDMHATSLPDDITDELLLVTGCKFNRTTRKFDTIPGIGLSVDLMRCFDFSTLASEAKVPARIWRVAFDHCKTVGDFRIALNFLLED